MRVALIMGALAAGLVLARSNDAAACGGPHGDVRGYEYSRPPAPEQRQVPAVEVKRVVVKRGTISLNGRGLVKILVEPDRPARERGEELKVVFRVVDGHPPEGFRTERHIASMPQPDLAVFVWDDTMGFAPFEATLEVRFVDKYDRTGPPALVKVKGGVAMFGAAGVFVIFVAMASLLLAARLVRKPRREKWEKLADELLAAPPQVGG